MIALNIVNSENVSKSLNENTASVGFIYRHIGETMLLPENVATSIVEKRLKLATRKNERNEKEIQFSIQSTGCH